MDDRTKTLLEQYKTFADVYKHHFDLYVKGYVVYFGAMGALCGFLYRQDHGAASKLYISFLIPIISIVAFIACVQSRKWVHDLKSAMEKIERELGVESFPFTGALGITFATFCGVVALFLFGLWNVWIFRGR